MTQMMFRQRIFENMRGEFVEGQEGKIFRLNVDSLTRKFLYVYSIWHEYEGGRGVECFGERLKIEI